MLSVFGPGPVHVATRPSVLEAAMQIARQLIDTRDPDEFTERIGRIARGTRVSPSASPVPFRGRAEIYALPGLALYAVGGANFHVEEPEGATEYGITVTRNGVPRVRHGAGLEDLPTGRVHLTHPTSGFDLRSDGDYQCLVARVDIGLADRYRRATRNHGRPQFLDLQQSGMPSLCQYLYYVWDEIQREGSSLRNPLIATEVASMTAALLGEVVSPTEPAATGHKEADRVRRAEEYIAAHLCEPLSLADMAEDLGLSVRSLSRAFRARHGCGPMTYLQDRRFEAARCSLALATPESTRVTDVAIRHGFGHLGRFSVEYRRRFGESPSETLAHQPPTMAKPGHDSTRIG